MPKLSPDISIPGLRINRKINVPAYKQLYEGLQLRIIKGQLRAKQRLPSSRVMANDIGVSRNIVLMAYEQLEMEGYITSAVGDGSYVADNIESLFGNPAIKINSPSKTDPPAETTVQFKYPLTPNFIKRESSRAEYIPFSNPVPALDEFPYKNWIKSAYKAFRGFEFLHLGYDDPQGYYLLRESIANYLRTNRALRCEAEQVVITNGIQQGLNLVADVLLTKEDSFWIEDPGYANAKAAFMRAGAKPCFIPLTKNGMNIDFAMRRYPNATAAYLTPSHQFPLGGTLPVSKRTQLLNWAYKKNMWIIEDDYDSEFRYSQRPIPSLQGLDQHKRVLYLGTFSKVLFPALRIGYMVLPDKAMAKVFAQAKAFADRQNPITDQAITYEFMKAGYFAIHVRKMRFLYKKRQEYLVDCIHKYGKGIMTAEIQKSGMHIIAWLNEKMDEVQVASVLHAAGIYVTPLSLYAEKYKQEPALLLGYTGFTEKKLREQVLQMIGLIKIYSSKKNS